MLELVLRVLVPLAAVPLPLGWLLARQDRPRGGRQAMLIAALPLPAFVASAAAVLILYGIAAPAGRCGPSGCGAVIAVGGLWIAIALATFAIGLLSAAAGLRLGRRRDARELDRVFE